MVTQDERVERFGELINKKANKQVKKHEDRAAKLLEKEVAALETELAHKLDSRLKFESDRINADTNKQISTLENEEKLKLANKREEIKADVFEIVRNKLSDFVTSDEYAAFLKERVKALCETLGDCSLYCREEDETLIRRISADFDNVKDVIVSKDIKIGGISASSPDGEVFAYDTLDVRLQKCKDDFLTIVPLK